MSRIGRKRKGGARHAGGKLKQDKPAIDKGTPEYQSRRAWAAGSGDAALTWHVLGILRAHDQITEEQYRAACEYRRCYVLLFRKPEVPAVSMEGMAKGKANEAPEHVIETAQKIMARMDRALDLIVKEHGRAARDAWCNLVVFDRTPRWMQPIFQRTSDVRDCRLFRVCIGAVEKAHGFKVAA